MSKKLFSMLLCLCVSIGMAFAQNMTVTGTVTSAEDGQPVIGASVFVQGTTNGAITDAAGKYTLRNVPAGSTLVFSCIGMQNQTQTAAQVVNVVLAPDTELLEQVVVTAQGLKRQEKAIGYSTVKIDAENLTIARQTDLGQSLAGKVSGARFYSRAGTNLDAGSIVLRGTSAFNNLSGSSPIFVIDGTIAGQGALNMDDVESVNILKGPAATALYGYQGANGAIIVTTRSAKSGETHVEFSHTTTMEKYYNHLKLQTAYGGGSYGRYGQYYGQNSKYANVDTMSPEWLLSNFESQNPDGSYNYDWGDDENWGPRFDPNVKVADALYWDPTSSKYMKADPWVAQFNPADMFQTGWANTTNVAVATSGKNYNSRISFTNAERTTIKQNTDAKRRYLTMKTTIDPTSWMTISLDYKLTYRKNHNGSSDGYGGVTSPLMDFAQWGHMNLNFKDYQDWERPDGSVRTWNITSNTNFAPTFHDNPWATMNLRNEYSATLYNVVTGDIEFKLPANFKLGGRVMGNITNSHSESRYHQAQYVRNFSSYYGESQSHAMTLTYQGRLTWDKSLINDRLGINAAAFVEQLNYDYGSLSGGTADGLTIPRYFNLAASNGIKSASNSETHYKTRSVFGNVTVGFDDTYFLDLSLRNDWDSRLPVANNHYLYGGASVSVMLNKFIKADWLDFWKLRASAAQVGSTLGAYNTTYTFSSGTKYNGTIAAQSQSTTQLNQSIKPTISTSYEVGTEFRIFRNRLHGDINLYNRDTKNQILNLPVAGQTGYNTRQINTGLVRNRGIEFEIGGDIIRTRDFTWNADFNIAKNVNTLVSLYPGYEEYFLGYNRFYYDFGIYANEGSPVGVMYTLSRWKRNDDGKLVVKPTTSAWWGEYQPVYEQGGDPKFIGNYQPDWTGGFSTNLRYKNWNLGASFDYTIGGQIFSYSNLWLTGSGMAEWTSAINDRGVNVREPVAKGGGIHVQGVTQDGTPVDTYMQATYYFQYQAMYDNDHWMYDRTYLKLREVSLTYTVPRKFINNLGIGLNSASISFVASNPWLIYSAVPNFDPSESSTDWLEGGQNPSSRTFGFTFKCRF